MQLWKMNLFFAFNQSVSAAIPSSLPLFMFKLVISNILAEKVLYLCLQTPFKPGEDKSYFTLTTPRKTFCVAVMSSSLCSVKLGWMLSFWAASSTCCPDTVTDSNRDDISMCKTSSSVSPISLEVKERLVLM